MILLLRSCFFFFNDTATTEIYTLSLHDALPISSSAKSPPTPFSAEPSSPSSSSSATSARSSSSSSATPPLSPTRSEEHTSELQSRQYLVCRLLLAKKKNTIMYVSSPPTSDWARR